MEHIKAFLCDVLKLTSVHQGHCLSWKAEDKVKKQDFILVLQNVNTALNRNEHPNKDKALEQKYKKLAFYILNCLQILNFLSFDLSIGQMNG